MLSLSGAFSNSKISLLGLILSDGGFRTCAFSAGQHNITMTAHLTLGNYDNLLRSLLKSAKILSNTEQCLANKTYTFEFTDKT